MPANTATIYEVIDSKTEECIGYGVELKGHCADEFGIDRDESFETAVDAHEFAEQCQIEADAHIVWDCIQPGWA
ncbi:hypothetical protein J4N45_10620 [Vibrio sp. SCSIO 43140]|uniref:hypothetical protein n=1 Tax=Vibrio sp. SCSIO 43140 TaxID=2819100 RepID=UPI0020756F6C|nr:hypothetical protein [Vibrio sp. SCSIO 43140]USD58984.1 hypothetical protein J4N45_10620 [Vibrio sp. SCSIO 43140]